MTLPGGKPPVRVHGEADPGLYQSLYEEKLLTYPRTDSRYLTSDMTETASCVIHLKSKVPLFDGINNFFPLMETLISDKEVSDHHAIILTMEIEKTDLKLLSVGGRNLCCWSNASCCVRLPIPMNMRQSQPLLTAAVIPSL